jgi:hypothetical protein
MRYPLRLQVTVIASQKKKKIPFHPQDKVKPCLKRKKIALLKLALGVARSTTTVEPPNS